MQDNASPIGVGKHYLILGNMHFIENEGNETNC